MLVGALDAFERVRRRPSRRLRYICLSSISSSRPCGQMRHESLSITSAITSWPWLSPPAKRPNSILRSTSSTSRRRQACARIVERQARHLAHDAEFLRRRDAARDDLIGLDQRIVVGVVLEEELDDARNEQRPAGEPRIALDERTRRDAAGHDLERNHVCAPHDHLVVVVVFAAGEIVRRQAAQVEQPEDARGRLRGEAALARDHVAARAVAGRNLIGLLDDELMRLARILVEYLRLAARDFDPFVHVTLTSLWRGNSGRRSMRSAKGARAAEPCRRGRSDRAAAGSPPDPEMRSARDLRRAGARADSPRRGDRFPRLQRRISESLRAELAGRRRRERPPSSRLACRQRARRCGSSRRCDVRRHAIHRRPGARG